MESELGSVVPAPAVFLRYVLPFAGEYTKAPAAYVVPETHRAAPEELAAELAEPAAANALAWAFVSEVFAAFLLFST